MGFELQFQGASERGWITRVQKITYSTKNIFKRAFDSVKASAKQLLKYYK